MNGCREVDIYLGVSELRQSEGSIRLVWSLKQRCRADALPAKVTADLEHLHSLATR